MESPALPLQVKYVGLRASAELTSWVALESAKLATFCNQLENCELSVGRWNLHQGGGRFYSVTLDVTLKADPHPLVSKFDSELEAEAPVLESLLRSTFEAAARQLAGIAKLKQA